MGKTILYIDGENLRHYVENVLTGRGVVKSKASILNIDLELLFKRILKGIKVSQKILEFKDHLGGGPPFWAFFALGSGHIGLVRWFLNFQRDKEFETGYLLEAIRIGGDTLEINENLSEKTLVRRAENHILVSSLSRKL